MRLPDQRIGRQPPDHVAARVNSFISLTLGLPGKRLEAGDDKRPQEQQVEIAEREDHIAWIFAADAP
jgi:hypothetical protein